LLNLLEAGDPDGDVGTARHANEAVGEPYSHQDQEVALRWLDEPVEDLSDKVRPRRFARWAARSSAGVWRPPPDSTTTSPTNRSKR